MTAGRPTSIRLSEEAETILHELEAHLGLKRSALMELALRRLYRDEGLDKPKGKGGKKSRKGD